MATIGFIILRHVNNQETGIYWKKCYESIRRFYKENQIMILDDNSNYEYIDTSYEVNLHNVIIKNNTLQARGEILPYLYFLNDKFSDIAVILHDSVFLNKYIDFSNISTCKMLWSFPKINPKYKNMIKVEKAIGGAFTGKKKYDKIKFNCDLTIPRSTKPIIKLLDNHEKILNYYENGDWYGCFGAMSVVSHSFLDKINQNHNLFNLETIIKSRHMRMAFERVWACLIQTHGCDKQAIFGDIFNHPKVFYAKYKDIPQLLHLPAIKIWTGR